MAWADRFRWSAEIRRDPDSLAVGVSRWVAGSQWWPVRRGRWFGRDQPSLMGYGIPGVALPGTALPGVLLNDAVLAVPPLVPYSAPGEGSASYSR